MILYIFVIVNKSHEKQPTMHLILVGFGHFVGFSVNEKIIGYHQIYPLNKCLLKE